MARNSRKKLTDEEYNVVLNYTSKLGLDVAFDICDRGKVDKWIDFDNHNRLYCLTTGFKWLSEAIAYPPERDLPAEKAQVIRRLLLEFLGEELPKGDKNGWILQKQNE